MAIPSIDEFNGCLSLLSESNAVDLDSDFERAYFSDVANTNGERLVRLVLEQRAQNCETVFEHRVMKWIEAQNVFAHAQRKLYAEIFREVEKTGLSEAERMEEHVKILMRRLVKAAADLDRPHRFRGVISDLKNPHGGMMHWYEGFVFALNEYLHSDTAQRMVSDRRTIESKLKTAIAGIEAIMALVDDSLAMEVLKSFRPSHRPAFWRKEILDAQLNGLRLLAAVDATAVYPIVRGDETIGERLFVYRMSRLNWRHFRSFKAEAIANLMMLEGFRVSLDTRTIEKLCKKFSDSRRQLFGQIEQLSAGA
ncbi:hypothetical protein PQQ53_14140 [Paraburkholderia strydomiana]|jgi:hypothetical protein|uniref:hypothetical protein n=1 Tax=Paraburkholderia strydomiana TaxID=1245417 RepID=UPI0038B93305